MAKKKTAEILQRSSPKQLVLSCRSGQTRTGDPNVPNVVRYQLRYTPNRVLFLKRCKGRNLFPIHQIFLKLFSTFFPIKL